MPKPVPWQIDPTSYPFSHRTETRFADMDEDAILMAESERQARVIRTPNQIEAVMAGMQKRSAIFTD